jgi:hypothetical protein
MFLRFIKLQNIVFKFILALMMIQILSFLVKKYFSASILWQIIISNLLKIKWWNYYSRFVTIKSIKRRPRIWSRPNKDWDMFVYINKYPGASTIFAKHFCKYLRQYYRYWNAIFCIPFITTKSTKYSVLIWCNSRNYINGNKSCFEGSFAL